MSTVRAAVVVGSGPSLTEADCELVRAWRLGHHDRLVVVCNLTFRRCPWADVCFAADDAWILLHGAEASQVFRGALWTSSAVGCDRFPGRFRYVEPVETAALPEDRATIGRGGRGPNTGFQALSLAVQLYAPGHVTLLGFDHQHSAGKAHWHDDYPAEMGNANLAHQPRWREAMDVLARHVAERGTVVRNASRETALSCFARVPIEAALAWR